MSFGKYAVDYEQRVNYDRLRKERVQRAKKQMEMDGIGALISFDHANIRYLTSYYVTTPMRNIETQLVFIARNGEPYLFGGGTPSETERRMPWLEGRVRPAALPVKMAAKDANDNLIKMFIKDIIKLMKEHGVEEEPLGIDGTTLQMLYAEAFNKKRIKVVHGKPTMDKARLIKTQDEIELMRITCANSETAFAAIADAIRPGIRECDLVGIGIKALYEEGDDHTEDLVQREQPPDLSKGHQVTIQRRLNDGREFKIVKVFYDPHDLVERFGTHNIPITVKKTDNFFLYGWGTKIEAD